MKIHTDDKEPKIYNFVGCEKFTKICPCGAMDTCLRRYDEEAGTGGGWDDSKLLKPCVVMGK